MSRVPNAPTARDWNPNPISREEALRRLPFKVGDAIEFESIPGVIARIGWVSRDGSDPVTHAQVDLELERSIPYGKTRRKKVPLVSTRQIKKV